MHDNHRNKDLAKIHIAKKQLGLDDDAYKAMLQMVAGVNSAAHLTATGRQKVLAHLKKAGFRTRPGKKHFPGRPNMNGLEGTGKAAMLKKIEAYLAEAKRPWSYVHKMAENMFKLKRVQWCHPGQLHRIIFALEYDARRHGRFTG